MTDSSMTDFFVDLFRDAATVLPSDVRDALTAAATKEEPGPGSAALETIIKNFEIAEAEGRPMCQDTGIPVFWIRKPASLSEKAVKETIMDATRKASREIPLRPNAVDILSGLNTGDNTGESFPVVHFEETDSECLEVELLLKGGGCENVGRMYSLPDAEIGAARDLDGVRRCVIDAVVRGQGKGCPPLIIGVAAGGARDVVAALSKRQIMRALTKSNPVLELAEMESRLLEEINSLGIGPSGLGGKTTALGVHIALTHRHPASFFVDVCFGCWAMRRAKGTFLREG